MRSRLRQLFAAALLAALSGCPERTGAVSSPDAGSAFDYNGFVCDVMPTLVRRCSYLACHGNAEHAFRVYSAGKLRRVPPPNRRERDSPLTAEEIDANYRSAVGVLLAASAAQRAALDLRYLPLLQKPLAARFGGGEHQGVALFPTYPAERPSTDPEWSSLAAWVAGARHDPAEERCAELFSALGVPPRSP
jgi:hypothetical protein